MRCSLTALLSVVCLCSLLIPAMGINVSFSAEGGGNAATSSSNYQLDRETRLESETNGWITDTSITGSGIARHNGLFVATDHPQVNTRISSAGQDVSITADGIKVASRSGDLLMGTGMLMENGSLLAGPDYTEGGGRIDAYKLLGYRWNSRNPDLKWVLKNDSILAAEGLASTDVKNAMEAAANTWDNASNQNLFADSDLVTLNPTVAPDTYNKMNTINWQSLRSNCNVLAYARTYYYKSRQVDGYGTAIESDLVFNANKNWRVDGGNSPDIIDVQSVALHEMGHTLGLGDIYGLDEYEFDNEQVMHYYTCEKRSLGNGDKSAIWMLYG